MAYSLSLAKEINIKFEGLDSLRFIAQPQYSTLVLH